MGDWLVVCADGIDAIKRAGVSRMNLVRLLDIFIIVFGLFLAYQIILYLLGGSWQSEGLIVGILILNSGILWKLSLKFEGHICWHEFKDGVR